MSDQRRALLTEREREILRGDADVTDNYRYSVESRVRSRLRERLQEDVELLLTHYPEIYDDLVYPIVCQPGGDRGDERTETETPAPKPADSHENDRDSGGDSGELGGVEFPGHVDAADATAAAFRARAVIRERGAATKAEIVREVMPDYPLGYDVDDALAKIDAGDRYRGAWWRRVVKPALEHLDDVEKPTGGRSKWRYTGKKT